VIRENFAAATQGFVAAVSQVGDGDWDRSALGEWTVRDLVGHTSRALSTVETYLAKPPGEITVHDPRDYLLAIQGPLVDPAAVAARGREAGHALGDDPLAAVRILATRVLALVAATADDALVGMALGGATLHTYLPTRTFELTVHTLDLVNAIGTDVPPTLGGPIAACLSLLASVAGARPEGATLLLALTGRRSLPGGFSLV
jgi:uncharacterized protein (TIGR03083 family)